ncbi:MAG: hypothetical protein ABIJ21_00030 [Nanoarchaeota archaeon]
MMVADKSSGVPERMVNDTVKTKQSLRQVLQLKAFRGVLCGKKGIMAPYSCLSEALQLPEEYIMVNLIDFGNEVEIELYEQNAIYAKNGIFSVLPDRFSSKFIPKDEFLELFFWFYIEDFQSQFFIRQPGYPLQQIEADPIIIQRYKKWVFVWLEDTKDDIIDFVSEYEGDTK